MSIKLDDEVAHSLIHYFLVIAAAISIIEA